MPSKRSPTSSFATFPSNATPRTYSPPRSRVFRIVPFTPSAPTSTAASTGDPSTVTPAGPAPTTMASNRCTGSRLQWAAHQGVYPSGQRGRAVNPLAQPTEVRILPPPLLLSSRRPADALECRSGFGRTEARANRLSNSDSNSRVSGRLDPEDLSGHGKPDGAIADREVA